RSRNFGEFITQKVKIPFCRYTYRNSKTNGCYLNVKLIEVYCKVVIKRYKKYFQQNLHVTNTKYELSPISETGNHGRLTKERLVKHP
ncbi:MAG: hypothetical protein WAT22_03730, partial [Saprospiraceae bacterium]